MLAAGPVQEAGLDSRIASCCPIPHIPGRGCRLNIVLAVYPQALHHLKGILLVLIRVGVRGFEERS